MATTRIIPLHINRGRQSPSVSEPAYIGQDFSSEFSCMALPFVVLFLIDRRVVKQAPSLCITINIALPERTLRVMKNLHDKLETYFHN